MKTIAVFLFLAVSASYAHANGCAKVQTYVASFGLERVLDYARRTLGWNDRQIVRFRARCNAQGYRL